MSRQSFAQLSRTLSSAASRRRLVAVAIGAVALGLAPGAGEAGPSLVDRSLAPDRAAPRRQPRRRPAPERRVRNFTVRSTHVVTEAAEAGCNNPAGPSGGICTTTFGGNGRAKHLGKVTYASSFTSDWSKAVETETEGFCAPVTGLVTLRTKSRNKGRRGLLTLTVKGTVCETMGDGESYPLVLNGSYSIKKGTGTYAGAKGNGRAEGAVHGAGAGSLASAFCKGKIRY